MAHPWISVVAPCFNEEAGLAEFVRRVQAACEAVGRSFEVVLVNDGSADGTWPLMLALAADRPWLVCVNLSRNHGHQLALTAGLRTCRGERVLIIDADLQDPPELLGPMLETLERTGADVVYGLRRARAGETRLKLWTASWFYRVIAAMSDVAIPPDTGDFRLMTARAVRVLLSMPERRRFIRGMVSWIGFTQVPIEYDRAARFAGRTGYSIRSMLRFAADALTSFSTRPLRWPAYAGGAALLGATGLGVWALTAGLAGGAWAAPMSGALILLVGGVQLLAIAVIGGYLGRLYEQALGRPLFVIDRVVHGGSAPARPASARAAGGATRSDDRLIEPAWTPARGEVSPPP